MLLKSLYRYILGDWSRLSPEEIKAIPELFNPFIKNKLFAGILKALHAETLHEHLFGQDTECVSHFLPDDDHIAKEIVSINKHYNYLPEPISSESVNAYKAYYLICNLVEELTESGSILFHSNAALNAYKLLIVYGEEDVEKGFEIFDNYCEAKQLLWSKNFMTEALKFNLRLSEKEQTINLVVWRRLLQGNNRDEALKFFYIAPEIEAKKGHAPFDLKQALVAAKSIKYAKRDESPTLAQLCESSFIPEEFYDNCFKACQEKRKQAVLAILANLPPLSRKEFILFMPSIGLGLHELQALLECLTPDESFIFVERFKQELIDNIKNLHDLKGLLSVLNSKKSQMQLVGVLTPEVVRNFVTQRDDLVEVIQKIHPDYHYDFLVSVIGKDKLILWVNNAFEYKIFLKNLLPAVNQISFLKALLSSDKIKSFGDELYYLEEQIKYITSLERYNYLSEIIGAKALIKLLGGSPMALISILNYLEQSQRLSLILKIVGIEEMRKMMPQSGYDEVKQKILKVLPDSDKKIFLETLPTEAEKFVLQAKNKIIHTTFATALMGMSGCTISLGEGKEKTVPKTVAKHWECIQMAERRAVTFEKALETMQSLVEKANKKTGLTYFSRSDEAVNYYDWFEKNAKKTCNSALHFEM